MTNAPWWISLVAAAIALLGVIIGQLLGAVIETGRSRREAKQRTFEHWRDQKFQAYSDFFRLIDAWTRAIFGVMATWNARAVFDSIEFVDNGDNDEEDDDDDAIDSQIYGEHSSAVSLESQIADDLARTMSAMLLVCSLRSYAPFGKTYTRIGELRMALHPRKGKLFSEDDFALPRDLIGDIMTLRESARTDLGIE